MASLIVRKLTAGVVVLDDIGLTITGPASTTFDLLSENANDISMSADLVAAIGVTLEVLDPRDGTTLLTTPNGILVIENHNLPHYGASGGRFGALDAPGTVPSDDFIVEYDSASGEYVQVDPAVVIGANGAAIADVVDGMLVDGTDTSVVYDPTATILVDGRDEATFNGTAPNGTFAGGDGAGGTAYVVSDTITMSDGSVITVDAVDGNGDVTAFTVTTSGATNVTPGVPLTQTSTSGTGTSFTLTPETPNISDGTIAVEVNDSFLRNDGDTLDSGSLVVASGADITIATGGDLIITDPPVNPTDATNKAYVDSVAAGLDPKESVRYCTVLDVGGTYTDQGSPTPDNITGVDLTSAAIFDGLTVGALAIGDRVLVKSQSSNLENGIYEVIVAGAAGELARASDHDGESPSAEVSGGNYTFVENGTTCANTGWVMQGDGEQTLNTDPIIFVQQSGAGTFTDGAGIDLTGNVFSLDVNDLTADTIVSTDELAFNDVSEPNVTNKTTVSDFLTDLNIVNNVAGTGMLVQTAPNTYASRSIAVDGLGPLDGLSIVNGDGVSANPTIGLDIENLPVQTAIDSTDRIAVWDSTADANVYYTVGDVAGALSSVNTFETWSGAGNTTGDAAIVADSATDTVTLTGGNGINIDLTAASDTLTLSLTRAGLSDTAVVGTDTVPFFDASNSDAPEFRSWNDIITDLGITTNIAAATDEDLLGIDVTGSVVGLDIDGLTDGAAELAATDEFPLHDKSEGTGGANRKMSGQNIADGVANILNLDGVTISTINGQPVLTVVDSTRSNKVLSADSHVYNFGENALSHLDWIRIGGATDADSGHIMPLDGTVVFGTAHCENTGGNSKDIHLFVDGVDQGSIGTLSGGANAEFTDATLNFDFTQGQKLRLQAQDSGSGNIQDTVANITVKWRA